MSVEKFPNPGIPIPFTGRAIWDAPTPNDEQVWGVCYSIHGHCKGCPGSEIDDDGDEVVQGCRAHAEQAARCVMVGMDDKQKAALNE